MLGALVGLVVRQFRSRTSLIAENELLRQQLAAAKSRLQRKRVMFTGSQRLTIALLTRCTASWRTTVTLVQPATVLRWHREGFRLLWRWRSRPRGRRPTRYATLIREMAARNARWGAERLRGELLKLGIRVSKRSTRAGSSSDGSGNKQPGRSTSASPPGKWSANASCHREPCRVPARSPIGLVAQGLPHACAGALFGSAPRVQSTVAQ